MDKLFGQVLDIKEVDPRFAELKQLLRICPDDAERVANLEAEIMQFLTRKGQILIFGALQQLGVIPK